MTCYNQTPFRRFCLFWFVVLCALRWQGVEGRIYIGKEHNEPCTTRIASFGTQVEYYEGITVHMQFLLDNPYLCSTTSNDFRPPQPQMLSDDWYFSNSTDDEFIAYGGDDDAAAFGFGAYDDGGG